MTPRAIRPTALQPAFTRLNLRAYASKTGQEGVTSGSSGTAEVPKENPHADQQNATSSAAEEVRRIPSMRYPQSIVADIYLDQRYR